MVRDCPKDCAQHVVSNRATLLVNLQHMSALRDL